MAALSQQEHTLTHAKALSREACSGAGFGPRTGKGTDEKTTRDSQDAGSEGPDFARIHFRIE